MKRHLIPFFLTTLAIAGTVHAADAPHLGTVNFGNCVSNSKLGKQEQASFENLKNQMSALLEDTEKQLNEITAKFNDPEFLDGLSPEAEEEMKNKFRVLNEDLSRYQNQYYQVLNQANMRVVQSLSTSVNTASEKVAKDKKLEMIMNKDACFYSLPFLDVTDLVIAEMDRNFDIEAKKQVAAPANEVQAHHGQKKEAKN